MRIVKGMVLALLICCLQHEGAKAQGGEVKPTKNETHLPARDGILLFTRIYLPQTIPADGLPAVLIRTPYTFPEDELRYDDNGEFFTSRDYAYVVQDIRGRGKSSGAFDVGNSLKESQDGFDTCEWIAQQAWSNSKIGSLGCSYPGFSSVAAAIDNPYVKVVISDDLWLDNRSDFHYPGHVPTLWPLNWLYRLDHGEWAPPGAIDYLGERLDPTVLDLELLGRTDPNWQTYLELYENMDSSYWDTHSLIPYLDRICAPVLILTDFPNLGFSPWALWEQLFEQGCPEQQDNIRFVFTREGHCYHSGRIPYERTRVNQLILDYLDKFLKETDIDLSDLAKIVIEEPGHTISVADSWPLGEHKVIYYLGNPSGRLDNGTLSPGVSSGEQLNWEIVPEVMAAKDMDYPELLFKSDPFQHDILIAGAVNLDLWIKATSPDVDFFAYLYERSQAGKEQLLTRMAVRAKYRHDSSAKKWMTGQEPILLELSAADFVYRVGAGSVLELRLVNNRPFSLENPLTGESLLKQTHRNSSQLSLFLGSRYPSKIGLPVVHREKKGLQRR